MMGLRRSHASSGRVGGRARRVPAGGRHARPAGGALGRPGGWPRAAAGLAVLGVVGVAAAAGSSTVALWSGGAAFGSLSIESGDIRLQECQSPAVAPSWREAAADVATPTGGTDFGELATYWAMPGDVIVMTYCVETVMKGDNLAATFDLDWGGIDRAADPDGVFYRQGLEALGLSPASTWRLTLDPSATTAGWDQWPAGAVAASIGQGREIEVVPSTDKRTGLAHAGPGPTGPDDRKVRWLVEVELVYQDLAANARAAAPATIAPPVATPTGNPGPEPAYRFPRKVGVLGFSIVANQVRSRLEAGF